MGATEKVLDVIHEIGILATMLLFIYVGGTMMQGYGGFGDFLPIVAGFGLMAIGALVVVRTPHRLRKRTAERYARLAYEDAEINAGTAANADADEEVVSTRPLVRVRA